MIVADTGTSRDFTPHPEGTFLGVCVDIIDRGMEPTQFGMKHRCQLAFETTELLTLDDGSMVPMIVRTKKYAVSLNEKANLRKDLERWRGRAFTPEELKGFDLERLLHANALLTITHRQDPKDPTKVYANVIGMLKPMKGMERLAPSGLYVRVQDRPQVPANGATPVSVSGSPAPVAATTVTPGQPGRPIPDTRLPDTRPAPAYRQQAATAQARRATAPFPPPAEPLAPTAPDDDWYDQSGTEDEIPF